MYTGQRCETPWQTAAEALDGVDGENGRVLLVIRMKVGSMMLPWARPGCVSSSPSFRRSLSQVGLGILAGAALIFAAGTMAHTTEFPGADRLGGGLSLAQIAMLLAYATLMLGVCLLACVVPTRRALGVEPTVALRVD